MRIENFTVNQQEATLGLNYLQYFPDLLHTFLTLRSITISSPDVLMFLVLLY